MESKTIIKTDDSKQSNMSDKSGEKETFLKTAVSPIKKKNIAISPIKERNTEVSNTTVTHNMQGN